MARARWIAVGFLLVAAIAAVVLNERGPFGTHPTVAYPAFLADFAAGRVERIVQWRDRLEVTVGDRLVSVTVPPEADLATDLGRARVAGGVGLSLTRLPDAWLGTLTPLVPGLILVAAAVTWATALVRNGRRAGWSATA
jgi:hypothetical protein